MRKIAIISIIFAIIFILVYIFLLRAGSDRNSSVSSNILNTSDNLNMIITSPSFENNGYIPAKFTCDGSSINPELQIENVPAEAKGLALIMHDPDAPLAGGFTHWLVWNIAASSEASLAPAGRDPIVIKENSVPAGCVEGKNDSGKIGYIGPCPPSGVHHYHFTIYALSAIIDLQSGSDKKSLETEIDKYLIARADLIGLYQRK